MFYNEIADFEFETHGPGILVSMHETIHLIINGLHRAIGRDDQRHIQLYYIALRQFQGMQAKVRQAPYRILRR